MSFGGIVQHLLRWHKAVLHWSALSTLGCTSLSKSGRPQYKERKARVWLLAHWACGLGLSATNCKSLVIWHCGPKSHRNYLKTNSENQGALKGTNPRGQTEPRRRVSQIFAHFCRFWPFPRKRSIWETQIFAENRRFSQKTARNRRKPQIGVCPLRFAPLINSENILSWNWDAWFPARVLSWDVLRSSLSSFFKTISLLRLCYLLVLWVF